MSYTYIAEIKSRKTTVASKTSSDLRKVVTWANSKSIVGDHIIISEGYLAADGVVDKHEQLNSWYSLL
tara:strand:- start:73 stop:276 length:204 start_codon:yes stop_codon:yes gene_type:complete